MLEILANTWQRQLARCRGEAPTLLRDCEAASWKGPGISLRGAYEFFLACVGGCCLKGPGKVRRQVRMEVVYCSPGKLLAGMDSQVPVRQVQRWSSYSVHGRLRAGVDRHVSACQVRMELLHCRLGGCLRWHLQGALKLAEVVPGAAAVEECIGALLGVRGQLEHGGEVLDGLAPPAQLIVGNAPALTQSVSGHCRGLGTFHACERCLCKKRAPVKQQKHRACMRRPCKPVSARARVRTRKHHLCPTSRCDGNFMLIQANIQGRGQAFVIAPHCTTFSK